MSVTVRKRIEDLKKSVPFFSHVLTRNHTVLNLQTKLRDSMDCVDKERKCKTNLKRRKMSGVYEVRRGSKEEAIVLDIV